MIGFSKLRGFLVAVSISVMMLPQLVQAQYEAVDDKPNPYAMFGDLVVARPVGFGLSVLGTATWVVSLPFTLLAGHAEEAAEQLIVGPGKSTFVRCLGCRRTGYTYKDIDNYRARQARREAEEAQAAGSD